jgi:hypothetical protein
MKIGDIVEQSAYSKKLEHMNWLPDDAVGLVVGRKTFYGNWQVQWYGRTGPVMMRRNWLKHAKARKK